MSSSDSSGERRSITGFDRCVFTRCEGCHRPISTPLCAGLRPTYTRSRVCLCACSVPEAHRNSNSACTLSEISERTGVKRSPPGTVLRRLQERGFVDHKRDYWAVGNEQVLRDAFRFYRDLGTPDERFGTGDREEWRDHATTDRSE